MKTFILFLIVLLASPLSSATDSTRIIVGWDGNVNHSPQGHYRIGLALSGGGARGLAQVGVLQALEENNLAIRAIAGTSIGGIIGGLYASGFSAKELDKVIRETDFGSLFSNRPSRTSMLLTQRQEKERFLLSLRFDNFAPYIPQALTAGQKLSDLLTRLTLRSNYISDGDFNRLPIPFRSITTDIVTGQSEVLSEGNLADAMRSTMAFPLAFTGIEKGDMLLMDGGMLNPIPVDVVKSIDSDLDLIIAVNTTSELLPLKKINNAVDIANQVTSIMTLDKLEEGLKKADIVITPNLSNYSSTDFGDAEMIIARGYTAGLEAVDIIKQRFIDARAGGKITIASIEFSGDNDFNKSVSFPLRTGQVVHRSDIKQIANNLYRDYNLLQLSVEIICGPTTNEDCPDAKIKINTIKSPNKNNLKYQINGNTVFDDLQIISAIDGGSGLLTAEVIKAFADSVENLYSSIGFDLAHIRKIEYTPDQNLLEIEIDEAIIEEIVITGNDKTKEWLIKSNFPLDRGQPIDSREARQGIANIYATDLFDRVTLNILPHDSGAIVKINVVEKKYTQIRLGWRWDDEYKSEEFVEFLHDNLFGTGQEFLTHARYSNRRQNYEISLKADRFFSTYLTYNIKGFYHILDRKIYDPSGNWDNSVRHNQYGIEFILGQQISRFGTVTGEIGWQEIESEYNPGDISDLIKLRTITLRSLVETIDTYPFPTTGKKHLFYVQFAADILGGEREYTKFFNSIESYFPIGSKINIHPKISIGLIDTRFAVPYSEQFYIGGAYSFYGYRTDELTGAKMILLNIGLRYRLPYRFYLGGRYDMGEVYSRIDQIKLRNLRHGFGFSLAYDSPLGALDFGYGRSGESPNRFYINIGLNF